MSDTIMIVDDNPDNLEVLNTLLSGNGYRVRPADSGKVALKALQHRPADLILLDIRMPDMDGYEVCRQLKADPATCDIPVIFISALHEPLDKVKAFETGGVDYVTKPFNHQEVLARVGTHLQLRGLQQRLQAQNEALETQVAHRTTALRETNAALEKALQAKSEFLMLMSHEFRTPLNGILGIAELLRDGLDPARQKSLNMLEQSGWRLLKLIDDILQVTRQGVPVVSEQSQTVQALDVAVLAAETLRTVAAPAKTKALVIKLDSDEVPPLEMPLDGSRLRQILGNLLDNAVKFTPDKGSVGLKIYYDKDAHILDINVWDTGPGIPAEERDRIFEPFVQLAPLSTRVQEGPGLGLALARNLVRLHGGDIEALSRPGGGSVFRIYLPAKQAAGAPEEAAPAESIATEAMPPEEQLPADQAGHLLKLTSAGDISSILQFVEELEQSGCCPVLTRKLGELARKFDIRAVRELAREQTGE